MILNLRGRVVNNSIYFELPPLFFQRNHFVKFNYLFIKWSKAVGDLFGEITTSLIDRTPFNRFQEILLFSQTQESNFLHYTPTHSAKYKSPVSLSSIISLQYFTFRETRNSRNSNSIRDHS